MLFNSWLFILVFLPAMLLSLGLAGSERQRLLILLAFSLVFYLLWSWQYLLLFLALIALNYVAGQAICACGKKSAALKILVCALAANILPLAWFKYSWFIIQNISLLFDPELRFTPPGLPPGISFYIFIQIAWLVGIYRREFRPMHPLAQLFFACGFPWVISGPIIRQEQIASRLAAPAPLTAPALASGLTLFVLGLAKKCLLADSVAPYTDAVFAAAEKGWPLSCAEGWLGSFSYSFQLYFDFSGYTDMALGLGLMIGLTLPENFNSPYKSTGIIDFWRRWHMTLGAWLRDFLYIPLGGNRKGRLRQYCNLWLTMFIAGIWHGAGWTFIIWGILHGAMLVINHFFRSAIAGKAPEKWLATLPFRIFFILLTFLLIDMCWVIFRAVSLDGALCMLNAMFDPFSLADDGLFPNRLFSDWRAFALPAICAAICWFFPNTGEIMAGKSRAIAWTPSRAWATSLAALFFISLILINRQTTFLYFQF